MVGLRAVSSPSNESKVTKNAIVLSALFVSDRIDEKLWFAIYKGATKATLIPELATSEEDEIGQSKKR